MRRHTRNILITISTIFAIIVAFTTIVLNINSIISLIPKNQVVDTSVPFEVSIEPSSIAAGEYYYPTYNPDNSITFTLIPNPNHNITYLELSKSSVIMDRANRTIQKVSSISYWDNTYGDFVFHYDSSNSFGPISTLHAKAHLNNCPNCFNDKAYPYFFTLNFIYTENNSAKKPYSVTIPFLIV